MDITASIKNQLSKVTPLVEAFLIIGISPETLHSHLSHNEDLQPKILAKFPPDYKAPETLPLFCFPSGASLVKSKSEVGTETFNFILTNENGEQIFCAAMVIYEIPGTDKTQARIFRTEGKNLQLIKHTQEEVIQPSQLSDIQSRRSRSFAKPLQHQIYHSPAQKDEDFQFISSDSFLVPKCLLLISKYPFQNTLKKILVSIFKLTRTHLTVPIECYITHLFLLVPLPPRGCTEIVYQILSSAIIIKVPPVNQLPLYDSNMSLLFNCLSIPTLMTVFTQLLIENNVIFLSSSKEKLCSCSYTLLSLLYPFKWSLVYVPVLPDQLIDYLYSPVKYVYGISSALKDDALIRSPFNACIVDLDEKKIENNDEMVNLHYQQSFDCQKVQLPEHYSKKLIKRLNQLINPNEHYAKKLAKKINEFINPKDEPIRIDQAKVLAIRNYFFQFFVSIFQNYQQYLNYEKYDVTDINTYFDQEGFLAKNKTDKDFFKAFFSTQMFANFCDRNIRTTNTEQKFENLLFNEHIISKKNRSKLTLHKKPTVFLSGTSQNYKLKYVVPAAETCFAKQGSFFYYTFPELNYEVLTEYGLPNKFHPKFTESPVSVPDIRLYEKQLSLGSKKQNLVCVIWLELWGITLWAQDECEHNKRMTEVISVLERMSKTSEKPSIKNYIDLIESCFNSSPSIALSIFSYMNTIKVLVDSAAVLVLQKVISKLFSNSNTMTLKSRQNTLEDLETPQIRNRVFNKKSKRFMPSHAINMVLISKCHVCAKEAVVSEAIEKICCKRPADVLIKVKIGIDTAKINYNTEEVKLLSIDELNAKFQDLKDNSGDLSFLDLEDIRENEVLFWNLIWYFNKHELPYRFFVPYESLKSDSFKVILSDDANQVIDITPQNKNDKHVQTDLDSVYLVSIMD
jgi:DENN (AEX-3) domain/uDENN domain